MRHSDVRLDASIALLVIVTASGCGMSGYNAFNLRWDHTADLCSPAQIECEAMAWWPATRSCRDKEAGSEAWYLCIDSFERECRDRLRTKIAVVTLKRRPNSESGSEIEIPPNGIPVEEFQTKSGWTRVHLADGRNGWVPSEALCLRYVTVD